MKSSLQTIQTLAKIAKVLCKIAFVFCIVGAVGCLLGICSLALGITGALKIGGVTIHGLIEQNAGVTLGTMYASMAAGLILCTAEAFLAEIAGNYFRHVLEVGTPFTFPLLSRTARTAAAFFTMCCGSAESSRR